MVACVQFRKSKIMDRVQENEPVRGKGKPNPVDVHVGSKLRLRRTLLGMSQEKLGDAIGLTFQQVQKYERGANRVGASRLYDLARVLEVPVEYFFADMPDEVASQSPVRLREINEEKVEAFVHEGDPMAKRETLELVRAYYKIVDPQVRKRLFEMTKALGTAAETAAEGAAKA